MMRLRSPAEMASYRQKSLARRDPKKPCVTICSGTGCHASGCEKVSKAFVRELESSGLKEQIDIRRTGCHGFCERGPIVVIFPEEICYLRVKPEDVPEIVSETLVNGRVIDRLLYEK